MEYLLDTSTCSLLMAHAPQVVAHLDSLSDVGNYVFTCTIVKGEILFGIQRLPIGHRRQVLDNQAINLLMDCHAILSQRKPADYYASMKRHAEQQGTLYQKMTFGSCDC